MLPVPSAEASMSSIFADPELTQLWAGIQDWAWGLWVSMGGVVHRGIRSASLSTFLNTGRKGRTGSCHCEPSWTGIEQSNKVLAVSTCVQYYYFGQFLPQVGLQGPI